MYKKKAKRNNKSLKILKSVLNITKAAFKPLALFLLLGGRADQKLTKISISDINTKFTNEEIISISGLEKFQIISQEGSSINSFRLFYKKNLSQNKVAFITFDGNGELNLINIMGGLSKSYSARNSFEENFGFSEFGTFRIGPKFFTSIYDQSANTVHILNHEFNNKFKLDLLILSLNGVSHDLYFPDFNGANSIDREYPYVFVVFQAYLLRINVGKMVVDGKTAADTSHVESIETTASSHISGFSSNNLSGSGILLIKHHSQIDNEIIFFPSLSTSTLSKETLKDSGGNLICDEILILENNSQLLCGNNGQKLKIYKFSEGSPTSQVTELTYEEAETYPQYLKFAFIDTEGFTYNNNFLEGLILAVVKDSSPKTKLVLLRKSTFSKVKEIEMDYEFELNEIIVSEHNVLFINPTDGFLLQWDLKRVPADSNCLEMQPGKEKFFSIECSKCKPGFSLDHNPTDESPEVCIQTCPLNKKNSFECHTVDSCKAENCKKCKNFEIKKCELCSNNYKIHKDDICIYDCGEIKDYIASVNSNCIDCRVNNCLKCETTTAECLECMSGFQKNKFDPKKCDSNCNEDYQIFEGNECFDCLEINNCSVCSSKEKCSKCREGFVYKGNGVCKEVDPSVGFIQFLHINFNKLKSKLELVFKEKIFDPEKINFQIHEKYQTDAITNPRSEKNGFIVKIKNGENSFFQNFEIIEAKRSEKNEHRLEITLDFFKNLKSGTAEIHITHPYSIISKDFDGYNSNYEKFKTLTPGSKNPYTLITKIDLENIQGQDKGVTQVMTTSAKVTQTTTTSFTGAAMFLSLPSYFLILKILQEIDYSLFINCPNIPLNVRSFLNYFEGDFLSILPNLFVQLSENFECQTKYKFRENEVECMFLNNTGSQLTQFLLFFVLKMILVVYVYFKFWRKENKEKKLGVEKVHDMSQTIDQVDVILTQEEKKSKNILFKFFTFLNFSFFVNSASTTILDFLLPAFINTGKFSTGSAWKISNLVISLITLITYSILLVMVWLRSIQLKKSKKKELMKVHIQSKFKNWLFLEKDINPNSKGIYCHFYALNFTRDILISSFVTFFMKVPILQISSLFCLQTGFLILIFAREPFESKKDNYGIRVREGFYTAYLACFLILIIFPGIEEDTAYKVIGWPMLFCMMGVIITGLIFLLAETLYEIYKLGKAGIKKAGGCFEKSSKVDQKPFALRSKIRADTMEMMRRRKEAQKRRREEEQAPSGGNTKEERKKKKFDDMFKDFKDFSKEVENRMERDQELREFGFPDDDEVKRKKERVKAKICIDESEEEKVENNEPGVRKKRTKKNRRRKRGNKND